MRADQPGGPMNLTIERGFCPEFCGSNPCLGPTFSEGPAAPAEFEGDVLRSAAQLYSGNPKELQHVGHRRFRSRILKSLLFRLRQIRR